MAIMAVAQSADDRSGELVADRCRCHDEVIVSKRMTLRETHPKHSSISHAAFSRAWKRQRGTGGGYGTSAAIPHALTGNPHYRTGSARSEEPILGSFRRNRCTCAVPIVGATRVAQRACSIAHRISPVTLVAQSPGAVVTFHDSRVNLPEAPQGEPMRKMRFALDCPPSPRAT
jgi:hypothetical protein